MSVRITADNSIQQLQVGIFDISKDSSAQKVLSEEGAMFGTPELSASAAPQSLDAASRRRRRTNHTERSTTLVGTPSLVESSPSGAAVKLFIQLCLTARLRHRQAS